jgi:hypothetical protein
MPIMRDDGNAPRQIGNESDLIARDVVVTRLDEAVGFFRRLAR